VTEDERLDAECAQCCDPNCGLYGCMKRPHQKADCCRQFAKDVTTFEGFILAVHDMLDRGYTAEGALTQVIVRAHKQIVEKRRTQTWST
jgi:hypothetical protein